MKREKISRRDFIRLALLGVGATFLVMFKRIFKPTVTDIPTPAAKPSKTNTPQPIETNTPNPTLTPTETPIPTPTEIPCFQLQSPENEAKLNVIGKVTFSWEAMQGAVNYKLEITLPSSQSVIFETNKISRDQYLEAFSMGGKYQWKVIAFDAKNKVICTAEPFTFEKSAYVPPKNNGGGGDGNGSDGSGSGSSGTGSSGSWSSGSEQ